MGLIRLEFKSETEMPAMLHNNREQPVRGQIETAESNVGWRKSQRLSRLRRRRDRYPWRRRGPLILRATEAENWQKNDSQQSNTDSEPDAFAKAFCQIYTNYNSYNDIHEWDEHQNHPPTGPTHYFTPHVHIVDGNDSGPAGATSFGEHLPHRHDHQ